MRKGPRPQLKPQEPSRPLATLLQIFAVALIIRLFHLWLMRDTPFASTLMGDSRRYDTWAREIASGGWMGTEVFYQAPLYPYLLGALYSVAGPSLGVVRVVQAIGGSVACVLLAFAGWRLFGRPVGIIAGLTLDLYAPAIFFDGLIQKSSLDVLFVCVLLALVAHLSPGGEDAGAGEAGRHPV